VPLFLMTRKVCRPGEDMAFLDSNSLGRQLKSSKYYSRGWHVGTCPNAKPGLIEEYTGRDEGGLNRVGFFAVYLDKCQYKLPLD
jgi:hypothetical protein